MLFLIKRNVGCFDFSTIDPQLHQHVNVKKLRIPNKKQRKILINQNIYTFRSPYSKFFQYLSLFTSKT